MLSHIEDGKVLDWHFKRCSVQQFRHKFYVGDIFVGQVFNMGRHSGWAAVSPYAGELNHAEGFKTRRHAADFLLKVRRHHRKPRVEGY